MGYRHDAFLKVGLFHELSEPEIDLGPVERHAVGIRTRRMGKPVVEARPRASTGAALRARRPSARLARARCWRSARPGWDSRRDCRLSLDRRPQRPRACCSRELRARRRCSLHRLRRCTRPYSRHRLTHSPNADPERGALRRFDRSSTAGTEALHPAGKLDARTSGAFSIGNHANDRVAATLPELDGMAGADGHRFDSSARTIVEVGVRKRRRADAVAGSDEHRQGAGSTRNVFDRSYEPAAVTEAPMLHGDDQWM